MIVRFHWSLLVISLFMTGVGLAFPGFTMHAHANNPSAAQMMQGQNLPGYILNQETNPFRQMIRQNQFDTFSDLDNAKDASPLIEYENSDGQPVNQDTFREELIDGLQRPWGLP